MKTKINITIIMIVFFAIRSNGQSFETGTSLLNAGVGIGGRFGVSNYSSQTPGMALSYERGMFEAGNAGVISLGGYFGFKSLKDVHTYSSKYYDSNLNEYYTRVVTRKWNYVIIGIKGTFHWTGLNSDKWDLYGGLLISDNILSYSREDNRRNVNYEYDDYGTYGSFISVTGFAGARYSFSDCFGAFGEVGYGISYLTLGASLKF